MNATHYTVDLAHGGHLTVPLLQTSVGFDGDEVFWVNVPGGTYQITTDGAAILLDLIDMAGQVDDPRPYRGKAVDVHPALKGVAD